jgi:hypothetical protein
MTRTYAFALCVAVSTGCGVEPASDLPPIQDRPIPAANGSWRLRINNQGPLPIRGLEVIFPDERLSFGDVPVGATTEYQRVLVGVFRFAIIRHQHGKRLTGNSVTDFVGETPLGLGAYTYEIMVEPAGSDLVTRIGKVIEDRE